MKETRKFLNTYQNIKKKVWVAGKAVHRGKLVSKTIVSIDTEKSFDKMQ